MNVNALQWTPAVTDDAATVLGLMAVFYAEEGLLFDAVLAEAALKELLARPELGRVFLLVDDRAEGKSDMRAVSGHLVLTFGFSLEFCGRFVLLDELYIAPDMRGQGWGKRGVEFAAAWAKEQGAASLRLEVNRANGHAREVYLRRGFKDEQRDLLTRWV